MISGLREIRRARPDSKVVDCSSQGGFTGVKHCNIRRAVVENVPIGPAGVGIARTIKNARELKLVVVEVLTTHMSACCEHPSVVKGCGIIFYSVSESYTARGCEIACAAAVLQVVDREAGTDLLGGASDGLLSRLRQSNRTVSDGCWKTLRGYTENCGGRSDGGS